jgi:hypothetical protein
MEGTAMPDVVDSDPIVEISVDPDAVMDRQQRLRELFDREPEIMSEVKHYFDLLKIDYARRTCEIELFLGFVESAEGLGTRLERVERFLGIKG